jgi:hypothetical protein
MPSTLSEAFALFGALAAWIVLSLLYGVSWNNLRVEIECHHQDLWRRLGSPPFSGYRRWGERRLFTRYVLTGRYRDEGDPVLTRLGNRARLSFAIVFLVWLTFAAGLFSFAAFR